MFLKVFFVLGLILATERRRSCNMIIYCEYIQTSASIKLRTITVKSIYDYGSRVLSGVRLASNFVEGTTSTFLGSGYSVVSWFEHAVACMCM